MCQAEIVVRPQHDPLLTVNDNDGVLRLGNRIEVRIEAHPLQLARFGELPALLEQRDLLELLGVHDASARRGSKHAHRYVSERLKVAAPQRGHKPEYIK